MIYIAITIWALGAFWMGRAMFGIIESPRARVIEFTVGTTLFFVAIILATKAA